MTEKLTRIGSGGPWEARYGYSRVVAAGPFVFVSGCTSVVDGAIKHEGDPYGQARTAIRVAEEALTGAGVSLADVVQTRIYIVHGRDADEVGRAHAEVFGETPPAAAMVIVGGLIDPRLLVEIEAVAYRGA
jgi:enamine deaminase RidA (YjgF/YER057c/UK114 family)